MKVGVYNRWLHVFGGGERFALSIARALATRYEVHFLSQRRIGPEEVAARLGLDVNPVRFITWPALPDDWLGPLARKYDVFINASHMGFVPPQAPRSVLVVYFPVWSGKAWWQPPLSWLIHNLVRRFTLAIEYLEGFSRTDGGVTLAGRGRIALVLPAKPALQQIHLRARVIPRAGETPPQLRLRTVGRTLTPVEIIAISQGGIAWEFLLTVQRDPGEGRVIELEVELWPSKPAFLSFTVRGLPYLAFHLLFERILPAGWERVHRVPPPHFLDLYRRYTRLWSISEFVRKWVEIRWGLDSEVLYPPVDVNSLRPGDKKRVILSVGRFFEGGHNKKQLEMVRAFRELVSGDGLDWELHLAGGVSDCPCDRQYLERVRREAESLPVFFHVNVPFASLRELYEQASIYWHWAGYGEDVDRNPERFEHFGISTVEAMAAGCVPVVINRAGQREIVTHGVNGFLWNDVDEALHYTRLLIRNPELRRSMAFNAQARSSEFGPQAFEMRVQKLFEEVLDAPKHG